MPPPFEPAAVLERLRRDLDRNVLRTRNVLKHIAGVGRPAVACSPKTLVWERDKARLYRYDSDDRRIRPPIVLVMSLVTKAYVFDLRPGNSFVEALLGRGFDVYSIDWGVPDVSDAANSIETYCDEYLPRVAERGARPQRRHRADDVRLLLRGLALAAVRRRPPVDARAQPWRDGDADRFQLHGQRRGDDPRRSCQIRRPHRRDGQRPCEHNA